MDINKLLQNKAVVFGTIGGLLLVIIILMVLILTTKGGGGGEETVKPEPKIAEEFQLIQTDDPGKAIEIQAMLGKYGIPFELGEAGGSKTKIIMKNYTEKQRDTALLLIVKNGLMDKNIGLEIFDKGDFTSSREDKRIRLARAVNGELARLIKRLDDVSDASVFVSIPDNSIFTTLRQPTTATVQIVPRIKSEDDISSKLSKETVRTITNLLMGSVPGLQAENISITDTNGNVYSSVISPEDDMMNLQEENDDYMKAKVMSQLDRLLGKGNYVVTVSTFLRQSPIETNKIIYNPKDSAVTNEQRFSESLGDRSRDSNKISSAVSTYLPGGLPAGPDSSSNRSYGRSAAELNYGVGKTQVQEYKKPGMIEEISIAVTLDRNVMPPDMPIDDFKALIAHAASPRVAAQNVQIAFAESNSPLLSPEKEAKLPKPEDSGNPWWTVAVLLGIVLIAGLVYISKKAKEHAYKQQREIESLLERTEVQQHQIQEAHSRAARLQEQQVEIQETLTAVQTAPPPPAISTLKQTIDDIKENIEDEEEIEFASQLKSWIESD